MTWKSLTFKVTGLSHLKQTLYHHWPLLKISVRHSEAVPRDLPSKTAASLQVWPQSKLFRQRLILAKFLLHSLNSNSSHMLSDLGLETFSFTIKFFVCLFNPSSWESSGFFLISSFCLFYLGEILLFWVSWNQRHKQNPFLPAGRTDQSPTQSWSESHAVTARVASTLQVFGSDATKSLVTSVIFACPTSSSLSIAIAIIRAGRDGPDTCHKAVPSLTLIPHMSQRAAKGSHLTPNWPFLLQGEAKAQQSHQDPSNRLSFDLPSTSLSQNEKAFL